MSHSSFWLLIQSRYCGMIHHFTLRHTRKSELCKLDTKWRTIRKQTLPLGFTSQRFGSASDSLPSAWSEKSRNGLWIVLCWFSHLHTDWEKAVGHQWDQEYWMTTCCTKDCWGLSPQTLLRGSYWPLQLHNEPHSCENCSSTKQAFSSVKRIHSSCKFSLHLEQQLQPHRGTWYSAFHLHFCSFIPY